MEEHWFILVIAALILILCLFAVCVAQKAEYYINTTISPPESVSDTVTNSKDPFILQQKLQDLVESKGYTWDQWNHNQVPKDIKWEITTQNSKNILEYLKDE